LFRDIHHAKALIEANLVSLVFVAAVPNAIIKHLAFSVIEERQQVCLRASFGLSAATTRLKFAVFALTIGSATRFVLAGMQSMIDIPFGDAILSIRQALLTLATHASGCRAIRDATIQVEAGCDHILADALPCAQHHICSFFCTVEHAYVLCGTRCSRCWRSTATTAHEH